VKTRYYDVADVAKGTGDGRRRRQGRLGVVKDDDGECFESIQYTFLRFIWLIRSNIGAM
jgi:hypothetical protein